MSVIDKIEAMGIGFSTECPVLLNYFNAVSDMLNTTNSVLYVKGRLKRSYSRAKRKNRASMLILLVEESLLPLLTLELDSDPDNMAETLKDSVKGYIYRAEALKSNKKYKESMGELSKSIRSCLYLLSNSVEKKQKLLSECLQHINTVLDKEAKGGKSG